MVTMTFSKLVIIAFVLNAGYYVFKKDQLKFLWCAFLAILLQIASSH
jgi:hypothetical protein